MTTRLAGLSFSDQAPDYADIIRSAARRIRREGTPPTVLLMNAVDYRALEDWSWWCQAETDIELYSLTYERRTTYLGQMAVARKKAARRGVRFDPRAWWAERKAS